MVPTQDHQQGADGRGHPQQAAVRKHVLIQTTPSILVPHAILFLLGVSIEDAQVKVAARRIDGGVRVTGVEDAVDNQIGEREEERANSSRMFLELLAAHEGIKNETRIRESRGWGEVGCRDGAGIRCVCLAKTGKEWDIVGAIRITVGILDGIRRSGCSRCVLRKNTEVTAGRMREVLVDLKESDKYTAASHSESRGNITPRL
jgi:hypothetical protein